MVYSSDPVALATSHMVVLIAPMNAKQTAQVVAMRKFFIPQLEFKVSFRTFAMLLDRNGCRALESLEHGQQDKSFSSY